MAQFPSSQEAWNYMIDQSILGLFMSSAIVVWIGYMATRVVFVSSGPPAAPSFMHSKYLPYDRFLCNVLGTQSPYQPQIQPGLIAFRLE